MQLMTKFVGVARVHDFTSLYPSPPFPPVGSALKARLLSIMEAVVRCFSFDKNRFMQIILIAFSQLGATDPLPINNVLLRVTR